MKKIIFIIALTFVFINIFAQSNNKKLLYLKLKTEIAPYPGSKNFTDFKNNNPEFLDIIDEYNISDIKCVFKSKSKNIQSIYYVSIPKTTNDLELIKVLEKINTVEYAEKPLKYNFSANVNDPSYSTEQWNLTKIQVSEAWDIYNGGSGHKTKIAIIDAAFTLNHEDLAGNFWQNTADIYGNGIDDDGNGFIDDTYGWDAADDDNDPETTSAETDGTYTHGTFVSGFAAAVTNNNKGIASVSYNNAQIMPIKVGRNNIVGDIEIPEGSLPYALDYAIANNAEIVSMSISSQNESYLGSNNGRTMHEIVQEASNMGIIMVAATGNNASTYSDISYPARYPEVIAVGSTDVNDYKASTSQYSTDVDIMAPGDLVYSTIHDSPYYQGGWSGTSFSTPTVAGALALMKSFQPTITVSQLTQCLYSGADDIESISANTPYVGKLGHGRLNVYKSMQCVDALFQTNEAPSCAVTSPQNGQVFTQGDEVVFSASASDIDGAIDSVVFVLDTTAFATYTTAPYQYNLLTDNATPIGTYNFYAIAYDDDLAFTNSDTVTVTLELATSVFNNENENKFSVFPNPATNNVQLTMSNIQLGESIKILDITGKVCKSNILVRENTIDISDLNNGVYFIKIGNKVQKFIKK